MKLYIAKQKLSQFFRLNLVALKLYNTYKYNIYLMILLFACVICSILLRSNTLLVQPAVPAVGWAVVELLMNNNYYNMIISIIVIFSTIYAFKLIFDIIVRSVQAYKIIPEFIKWYNDPLPKILKIHIKSIMTLYYIQNMFFMLLSGWILYIIMIKLNLFIDNIYLYILTSGIISSIVFIHYYPPSHTSFNLISQTKIKDLPLWVYVSFILFIFFYMFILPLLIIKIINSDKFINYFKDYELIHNYLKNTYNYMNPNNRRLVSNNTVAPHSSQNRVLITANEARRSSTYNLEVVNNSVINRYNNIQIIPTHTAEGRNNNTYSTFGIDITALLPEVQTNLTNNHTQFNVNAFPSATTSLTVPTVGTVTPYAVPIPTAEGEAKVGNASHSHSYSHSHSHSQHHKKYVSLSRQIVSLCYNWNLDNMSKIDHYYLNKKYIKMITDGTVTYYYNTLNSIISIIYPNKNYYNNGPWSKYLNSYEFEYKLDNNNIYFKRIIENNPNNFKLANQPNLLHYKYSHNIDENKWLYCFAPAHNTSNNINIFEYLTDSKVIIRVEFKDNLTYEQDLFKLTQLMLEQPLDDLVLNDTSSNKMLLRKYLIEQQLDLNSYYVKNINNLGYWTNKNNITFDYLNNNIIDRESKNRYIECLIETALSQHPINKDLITFNNKSYNNIGFVLLNNVMEIPLLNNNFLSKGKILSIKFMHINDMEKEVTYRINQMDTQPYSIKNKELILRSFEYLKTLIK